MIEPDAPMTIWIKHPAYPAFLLASDEGKPLKPSSVILRHRHLCQQQRIIPSGILPSENERLAQRTAVEAPVFYARDSESAGPSTSGRSPASLPRFQSPPLSIADDASQAASPTATTQNAGSSDTSATATDSLSKGVLSALSGATSADVTSSLSRSKKVETSIGPLVVTHQERALRARGNKPHIRREKTTWYFSASVQFLDAPPTLPDVRFGELYVHEGPGKQKQVWVWSRESSWSPLQVAAPHPYLSDYILNFCSNGEPSWVTKETLRTYIGRVRKREADQQTAESRHSSTISQ